MKIRSVPCSAGPSDFGARLLLLNDLAGRGFAAWELVPGMRFGERLAWWRGDGERTAPHEGLDLCRYRTAGGRLASLGAGARVPVAYPGELVAVAEDFLGHSAFVAHEPRDEAGWRLHTIYGHIRVREGLAPGSRLRGGEEIGTVADIAGGKAAVPPHLHLTVAWIAPDDSHGPLDWTALRDQSRVVLVDPLPLLNLSHAT